MLTSQQERKEAILMLAGAQERFSYRSDIDGSLNVSIALTSLECAALLDFSEVD